MAFADVYDENGALANASTSAGGETATLHRVVCVRARSVVSSHGVVQLIDVLARLPPPNAHLLGLFVYLLSEAVRNGVRTRMSGA
jgi:hypothetical protein